MYTFEVFPNKESTEDSYCLTSLSLSDNSTDIPCKVIILNAIGIPCMCIIRQRLLS